MKYRIKPASFLPLALAAALVLLAVLPISASEDGAPGTLEFKASNKMYSASGKFERWHFTKIELADGGLEGATIEFEIDLASVWEKAAKLADHLRTADFFEVETFAKSTVRVHDIKKTGESTYEGTATVDLHGATGDVPVTFEVLAMEPLKVSGQAVLSRTAFGIGGPVEEGNDRSITDGVEIHLEAVLAH